MKKGVLKIGNRQIVVVKSENGYAFAGVENDEFKESDHPRDKGGKFTSKGGAGSGSGSKGKPAEKKEGGNGSEKAKKILGDLKPMDFSPNGEGEDLRLRSLYRVRRDLRNAVEKASIESDGVKKEVKKKMTDFVSGTEKNIHKLPEGQRDDAKKELDAIKKLSERL